MLYKRSVLAAKIETTPGTDATLAAADGAMNVYNATLVPQIEMVDREAQGSFNRLSSVPAGYKGQATFTTYFDGWDGTSTKPKWAEVFFPACGWVLDTNTYTPRSEAPGANVKTLTIGLYREGDLGARVAKLTGAVGTFVLNLNPGQPASIDWTFEGVWQGVVDDTMIAPTLPTEKPLRFANGASSWNSVDLCFNAAQINAGNTLYIRECVANPSGQAAAGFHSGIITDRVPRISVSPESVLVASQDRYGKLLDMSEHSLAFSFEGLSGVTSPAEVAISIPAAQIASISDGDRNGVLVDQIEFAANRNGANNDQELSIEFTPLVN